MRHINLTDHDAIAQITHVFQSDFPVVILEFPNVFGLMAPHSLKGARCLDKIKDRLPNKCYGSFLGDANLFRNLLTDNQLETFDFLKKDIIGTFIRFPLKYPAKNEGVTYENTHQVLLENTILNHFMMRIDLAMRQVNSCSDFYAYNYQSPIITSLNMSGSPDGAITNLEDAIQFGEARDIPLFVHTHMLSKPLGSYPIFSFNEINELTCERDGIKKDELQQQLETFLFSIR
jgi:hypothetical protein